MRIVFFGTPEFARKSLEHLYSCNRNVVGVFTQADKPRNRGMKVSYTPVKELALEHGTPVYQPDTLRDGSVAAILNELQCDLIAVVAYGKFLPREILELPRYGCVNIHASLLPKYRGAAPIQHAILNGESETGVAAQFMSEKMDEGDIIGVRKTPISFDDTSVSLAERLSELGATLLNDTITDISGNKITRTSQNHCEATYASLLTREMSPIDWNKTALEIDCQIRGLLPWPTAAMEFNGKTLKVFSASVTNNVNCGSPGTIISGGSDGIEIACADRSILIREVQAPGGKRMSAADYLKGNPYEV